MIRSLRFRLTAGALVVLAVVLGIFALVVHLVFGQALMRQFDARLSANAAAVAGMAEDGTPPEFEYEALPEFERPVRPGFFQAWLDDGRVLARSPSLGTRDLPRLGPGLDEPTFAALTLPDGRVGRAVAQRQPLRLEDAAPGAPPSQRSVTVVVAAGTEEVDETLAAMSRWLWLLGLAALVVGAVGASVAVARGLRSVRRLAAEIGRRDESDLGRALPRDLPTELRPVVDKLEALFERLAASFERERRFTADVSHELRTPLAALRTILEVSASRDRDAVAYRASLYEATALVEQTQALVQNLLTLARLDARQVEVKSEALRLRAFVEECWRAFSASAGERGLVFSNDIPPGATLTIDPEKFRIVVTNLLSNAVEYTAARGAIHVREGRDEVVLEVRDTGPPIPEHVLPRIFDRFSRADPARSGGIHSGVGLALVRAVCDVLDLSVAAENEGDGSVRFVVRRAARSTARPLRGIHPDVERTSSRSAPAD
jgi:signal transduction histidine kinase